MTRIADLERLGILPMQHHDTAGKAWDDDFRLLMFGGRVRTTDDDRKELEEETFGPVPGAILWRSKDNDVWPRFWAFAAAATWQDDRTSLPCVGPEWDAVDDRSENEEPKTAHKQAFPGGWSHVVLGAASYAEQRMLALAGFDGVVTQHWGDHDLGSPWWDARDGKLDAKYRSRTQSLARVVRPPQSGCYATDEPLLALQLEGSPSPPGRGEDRFIGGFVCDRLTAGGREGTTVDAANSRPQSIGALSFHRGGPLMVPSLNCQHLSGRNDDREPFGPAHIWTGALFSDPANTLDGPLDFEFRRYDTSARDFPFKTRGHITFDPLPPHVTECGEYRGRWKIESSTHIGEVKKKEEPPPEPPPPGGDPDGVLLFPPGSFGEPFDGSGSGPRIVPLEPRDDGKRPSLIGDGPTLRPLYGTSMEVAQPAVVWHAASFCPEDEDTRSITALSETGREQWASRPAVARTEAYGHQRECFFVTSHATDGSRLRYLEVDTASGGVVDMPPELGIERVAEWEVEGGPLAASVSTAYRVLWDMRLAFATPDLASGGVRNGWVVRRNGTALDFGVSDSSAAITDGVMKVETTGTFELKNTLGHRAILTPASLTASRTFTLPDSSGTLALLEVAQTFSAKQTFSAEVELDGALNHDGSTVGFYGVTPVARDTGWTVTNSVESRSFDTTTVTTAELAEVVGTLIDALGNLGLISASLS